MKNWFPKLRVSSYSTIFITSFPLILSKFCSYSLVFYIFFPISLSQSLIYVSFFIFINVLFVGHLCQPTSLCFTSDFLDSTLLYFLSLFFYSIFNQTIIFEL